MPYLRIFRLCLVILFLEFILIRWLSTEISILAYLQNSVLVACFLGLGMGLIAPKSGDDPSRCLLPLLFLTAITSIPGVREGIRESAISLSYFHDFVVWNEASKVAPIPLISALLILFSILGSCWAIMVPLGAELGRLLETTPQRLLAYSADIFGSLVGVLLFTLLAYLSLNPVWWFFILSALLFLFGGTFHSRQNILSIVLILGFSLLGKFTEDADLTVWTPYQKIEFLNLSKKGEWVVIVNNSGFQQIQNNLDLYKLSRDDQIPNQYNIPSRIASPARRALVVGAGTGNDVAGL